MINDDYYEIYENLCNEVGRAFQDAAILKCIRDSSKVIFDKKHPTNQIVFHLCELTKMDLALTIYKIWLDNKSKKTVKSFNKAFPNRRGIKLKLTDNTRIIEKPLREIRNKYLAHIDPTKELISLDVDLMIDALIEISEMISAIGNNSIDERVLPIPKNCFNIIKMKTMIGFEPMINHLFNKEEEQNNA